MSQKQYILVTGGAGYIGSHTVVALHEQGYIPVIVDDYRNSTKQVIPNLSRIIGYTPEHVVVDICDIQALRKQVFEQYQFSGIIHFAADKAVGESVQKPLKYYRNNLTSLINCIDLCEEFSVPFFVFSSSCTVYGVPDEIPVNEGTQIKEANSPYGATKQIGERIIQDVHLSGSKIRFIALRYFNPVGAHPSALIGELPLGIPNNLLPFITQTGAGIRDQLTVHGTDYPTVDGSCIRDYIHVLDLADAHCKALKFLENVSEPLVEFVNVGTGKGTSVLEMVSCFESVSGKQLNWRVGPRRPGDVPEIFANTSKAERVLNWKSKYSVEEAVRDAWHWELNLRNEK